jgi:hypothetical protein
VTVEPDVAGFSPVASEATKLFVMSALARRQRRAALRCVFELGISDMACRPFVGRAAAQGSKRGLEGSQHHRSAIYHNFN